MSRLIPILNQKTLVVSVVAAAALALPSVAFAASSTGGDSTPNFTESGTCGTYGVLGPLSPTTTIADRIYGPFADFFGRDRGQVLNSTVIWTAPNGYRFRVHGRTKAAFDEVYRNIQSSGAAWYQIGSGSGAWAWRNVGGNRGMSQHAVGNAADINPSRNPYRSDGRLITDMPRAWINAWKQADFCWGGDWQWSKDTMHFAWRGPAADKGSSIRAAPFDPLTSAASFTTRVLNNTIAVPPSAVYAMADKRRDGADDLYALYPSGGRWHMEVAGAVSGFQTVGVRRGTGAPAGNPLFLADIDGDGRADLLRSNTAGTIAFNLYLDESRHRTEGFLSTGATWSADAEIGFAVFDWGDWKPDLFVIRRNTGTVEVYSSTTGFQQKTFESTLSAPIAASDKIVLADRARGGDVDGTADIWLVGTGSPAQVRIANHTLFDGYGGPTENLTTGMSVSATAHVLPGDYDGDGHVDLYVVDSGRVSVWLGGVPDRPLNLLSNWFTPGGPNTFDAGPVCVGECDQIGYVDDHGLWRLAHQLQWAPEETNIYYGVPGDLPFLGDWDCDGDETPGLYRRSSGFAYLRNSNTQGIADTSFFFGNPSDIPLAGDFDGDGCDTVSIYRPSEQRFYIINRLGTNGGSLGAADYHFVFGDPGDKPFIGDFDGDGIDEVGLHRESTGRVYYRNTLDTGFADRDFVYGNPGDFLLAGDWNGDGIDTPVIYRPSQGNWYFRLSNTQGFADHVMGFGRADWPYLPVAGGTRLSSWAGDAKPMEVTPPEGG